MTRSRQGRLCFTLFIAATAAACFEPELAESAAAATTTSATDLIAALDLPASLRPTAISLVSPDPYAALVSTSYGALVPSKGDSFLLLSTGRSGDYGLYAEPGMDFGPLGPAGDVVTLRFFVTVPPEANRLSFDYRFLSAEAPERIGPYGDQFTLTITDASGTRQALIVSTTTAELQPVTDKIVGNNPFLLYVDDPAGIDTVFNHGDYVDAGVTSQERVDVPIAPGQVTLELDLRDIGDGLVDSAILLDNFEFSAVSLIDPRDGLIDEIGRVVRDPAVLSTGGTPIHSVATDKATQILLRSKVAGPGLVTFSLPAGLTSNGSLNTGQSPSWTTSVTVDTALVQGQYYAFALYRSPHDFVRDAADTSLPSRDVSLLMTYQPSSGGGFTEEVTIILVRPPVVVVPTIWSSCVSWFNPGSLLEEGVVVGFPLSMFRSSCVDYDVAKGFADPANLAAIRDGIEDSLASLRNEGVAVTQVDVIGHGMGALLARRLLDEPSYLRPSNFYEGPINRLLSMNAPHLGARLADELVKFREFAKQRGVWNGINDLLKQVGIFIDSAEGHIVLDEMQSNSSAINSIGTGAGSQHVFHHALISAGGRALTRPLGLSRLSNMRALYMQMENHHPSTYLLSTLLKQRLIFGPLSYIFCADGMASVEEDHDLFATVWEQQGGLPRQFTSEFSVSGPTSSHFNVHYDPAHTTRLIQLLDSPVEGGLFTSNFPPTATVPRINHCPLPPAPPL